MMAFSVAIVEDDADILDLLREALQSEGFVVSAFSMPDIRRIVEMEQVPSLFLIDLMLPGTTGVELASHLRTTRFPDTPMIAMSASRLMLGLATGSGFFQDTMAKPFNLSTLLDTVERLARSQRPAPGQQSTAS